MRDWVVKRRARTRHLIGLGGLIVKAALIELTGDDRALLYGALLAVADTLRGENRERARSRWRQRGSEAFKSEKTAPALTTQGKE
jgi:hypothetical protein